MIFVDTNYFLRFLLKDNEKQYVQAKKLFLDCAHSKLKLITSTIVFFEIAWVLKSVYKKDRQSLNNTLTKLLSLNIVFEEGQALQEALIFFRNTSLEFVDCYNLAFALKKKVKDFKTFDQKLRKQFEKN